MAETTPTTDLRCPKCGGAIQATIVAEHYYTLGFPPGVVVEVRNYDDAEGVPPDDHENMGTDERTGKRYVIETWDRR